jgi:hypothetical protein
VQLSVKSLTPTTVRNVPKPAAAVLNLAVKCLKQWRKIIYLPIGCCMGDRAQPSPYAIEIGAESVPALAKFYEMEPIQNCPCCSDKLLRHIQGASIHWFCRSCWQKMPVPKSKAGQAKSSLSHFLYSRNFSNLSANLSALSQV